MKSIGVLIGVFLVAWAIVSFGNRRNTTELAVETSTPPVAPSTATTDSAEKTFPCNHDWTKCKDNSDMANNYSDYVMVRVRCEKKARELAKYGTPVFPGIWSGGAFATFNKGTDYVQTGIVTAVENGAQYSNGFGAMVHSTVTCKYDLHTNSVIDVIVAAND